MTLRRTSFPALLLAASALAPSAAAPQGFSSPAAGVLQPKSYVSLQPVPRGRLFEIAVVAKITPGYHVNAHQPAEDYLIPTRITAELPAGVRLVETTYPRGIMRKFQFSETALRVYENSFTVRMKLRASATAPMGPQKIPLTIQYQACTQEMCLQPAKVAATAEIDVAAEDTPALSANPAIFSPRARAKAPAQR